MTALAPDPVPVAEEQELSASQELFAVLDAMEVPRGARAEILDGETITVSPTPIGLHQENVYLLDEQLRNAMPKGHRSEGYLEIRVPYIDRCVIPDLFIAPREVLVTDQHYIAPDEVLLVAEVVSKGSRRRDHEEKPAIYARSAIPAYLLVDPGEGRVTLYSNPEGELYRERVTRDFGDALRLPEPFGFTLETGGFLRYP
ncbi:Uma2 family endonuclease [Murinocardiopsis flavida]|uniref:Uma2 family endonuclease n=2 Tax=Murinocardiopsis flavida TaxID=645275 RepID=A0A2P8DSE0_9ACTN|nr:Uma2 family endonuclease [Murinocardiopsis flavida]